MIEITELSLSDLAAATRAGRYSAVEVVDAFIQRAIAGNDEINAICTWAIDEAMAAAKEADKRFAAGETVGPLHGVPVVVKDTIFTAGVRTTGGSLLYKDFVPDIDDVAVARLRSAGAIVIGKSNVPEFGFSGNQTANRLFGQTRNPWNLELTPGASSGGSAAAVAAGLVPMALGSDGGGSIRIPAGYCGVFGIKPTFGLVPLYPGCRDPRFPGLSGWESLEHIGPITRNARDSALVLDVIAGLDTRDRHSVPRPPGARYTDALPPSRRPLRVAYSVDWGGQSVDAEVRTGFLAMIEKLGALELDLVEDEPPITDTVATFGAYVPVDFDAPAIARLAAGREDLLGPRVRALIEDPTPPDMVAAVRSRKLIYQAIEEFMRRYDLFLTPTVPATAFPLHDDGPRTVGGVRARDQRRAIVGYCCPFNLSGHPAASVGIGRDARGVPIGMQIAAPKFAEREIFAFASLVEEIRGEWPWPDSRGALTESRS